MNGIEEPSEGILQMYGPKGLRSAHPYFKTFTKIQQSCLIDVRTGLSSDSSSSGPLGAIPLEFAPNHVVEVVPVAAGSDVSYMFHLPQRRGKFLVERARALGVRQGVKYGQLAQGVDVLSEDGEIVKAADCIEKPEPRSIVGVITCPTMRCFRRISSNPKMKQYTYASRDDTHGIVSCVYHRTPQHIVATDAYTNWMDSFGEDVHHIILNRETSHRSTAMPRSASVHHQLNKVCPDIYPAIPPEVLLKGGGEGAILRRGLAGDMLERFTLSPHRSVGPERNECPPTLDFKKRRLWSDVYKSVGAIDDMKRLNEERELDAHSDADVTILGSGSMQPATYRNVSSIALQTPKGAALLDCGEGTLLQLQRLQGSRQAARFVSEDLKVV